MMHRAERLSREGGDRRGQDICASGERRMWLREAEGVAVWACMICGGRRRPFYGSRSRARARM